MKKFKITFLTVILLTETLFGAQAPIKPDSVQRPTYITQLPAELREELLNYALHGKEYPDPKAIANTILAMQDKITPKALLAILEPLPTAIALEVTAYLKNLPIIQSREVAEWIAKAPTQLINGQTLFDAVDKNNLDRIQKLLQNPFIDVNWRNTTERARGQGLTSLLHAMNIRMSLQRSTEISDLLLKAGANPNLASHEKDPITGGFKNWTVLAAAASRGNYPLVQMLLRANADVNHQDSLGDTPLMEATQNRHVNIIKSLLAAGANPTIKNQAGKTAKDLTFDKDVQQLLDAASAKK